MKTKNCIHKSTEAKRKDILLAALACFTELGFTNTSMAAICKRATASIGSVYHHFISKEYLAAQVYLEGIRDYQSGCLSVFEAHHEVKSGIFAIVHYHLRWVANNKEWARYLNQMRHQEFMGPSIEEKFAKLNSEFFGEVAEWFRVHIKSGAIRKMAPELYLAVLMGPCQELTRIYCAGSVPIDLEKAAKGLAVAVWRSLKSD